MLPMDQQLMENFECTEKQGPPEVENLECRSAGTNHGINITNAQNNLKQSVFNAQYSMQYAENVPENANHQNQYYRKRSIPYNNFFRKPSIPNSEFMMSQKERTVLYQTPTAYNPMGYANFVDLSRINDHFNQKLERVQNLLKPSSTSQANSSITSEFKPDFTGLLKQQIN